VVFYLLVPRYLPKHFSNFLLPSLLTELILGMGYGYEVQGQNDRRANVSREMAQLASETTLPGAVLVNDLPFREWFLGIGFIWL